MGDFNYEDEGESKKTEERLRERRDPGEIKEYFEQSLEERDEELAKLSSRMEESLEDFDERIKVLLTGKTKDTSKAEEEIEDLTSQYKNILKEYLRYLQFTKDIEVEFDGDEVILGGMRNC